jgi:transposase
VAKYLSLAAGTVAGVLRRYKANGNRVLLRRNRCGRKPKASTLEALKYLESDKCLQEWASLTLRERADVLQSELGITVSKERIAYWYGKLNIRYTKPQKTYWYTEKRMREIRQQREEFCIQLAEIITTGKPIVYFDETSFNFHMRNSRCW